MVSSRHGRQTTQLRSVSRSSSAVWRSRKGRAEAAVEVGDDAEQLGGLAQAARDEQHLGGRDEQGLDQAEEGDDGRFAGLATAVEQQPGVAGRRSIASGRILSRGVFRRAPR